MAAITNSGKQVNKEYGKRPYVDEVPKEYIEYSKRPTDKEMFDRLEEKHSEFKKPYMFDDYQEMEHYYFGPTEWWSPGWDLGGSSNDGSGWSVNWWMGDYKGDSPADDEAAGWIGWYIIGCAIECDHILLRTEDGTCSEEVCCYFNPAWQTIARVEIITADAPVTFTKNDPDDWNFHLPGTTRKGFCFKMDDDAGGPSSFEIEASTIPTGIQRKAGTCKVRTFYNCGCDCATVDTFAIDTGASATTITPGGTAVVVVQGGCEDYTWSVSGTGYTLDNATTTGLSNTLNSASGTCGVDYGPVATVTITDNCSTQITAKIRNTGGQWVNQTNTDCESGTGTDATCYTILEDHRYGVHSKHGGSAFDFSGCDRGSATAQNYCYGQWNYSCVSILEADASRYSCASSPLLLPCCLNDEIGTECYRMNTGSCGNPSVSHARRVFSNLTDDLWEC